LAEAKERLKYADYYLPITKATRKILELGSLFNREKGSQTVEDGILKQLDSLDKGFAKDDYQYLGAKLRALTYLNNGDYRGILYQVPYEYLPSENDIDNKLRHDLENGDFSNVKKAMELSFTKFKGNYYYPRNMSNTSNSLHDSFGGLIYKIQNKDSLQQAYKIITDLEDLKNPIVNDMLKGMKTYVEARLATDQKELAEIASIHFNSVYDMAGRYRILIYDELVKKQIPDSIQLAYIDYTIDLIQKKIDQINSGKIENVNQFSFDLFLKDNNVVSKKNLADAYYRKSKLMKNEAVSYLQMAADYLPTQQDISDNEDGLKNEYKFTPFMPYTDLFLASGGNAGMTEEDKLNKYVDMVILEPERYATLKDKYTKVYPKGDFKAFFIKALKSKLPAVPGFSLNERSGKVVTNKDQKSKFVFVDFWGTWCGACVAEIDKIEKVHLKNPAPEKLLVTTIACFDKKKNVDDFMEKEKYTYEVLLSDGKVEKDFKIRSYPTKLLLLPNGVYLTISFYSNYEDILNKYLKWEI
jgi:thiol-disulfide isomerase/thioredoxin